MFNQSFRKFAFLALIGIWIISYIKAEQPNLGDLNLTAESQLIYYPTGSGTSKIYWSDLSETIQDLNLTGDPSSFNEDTKYLIKKNFLKNEVPSAFEKLDPNHYTWSEDTTEKRNEVIKAIYSKEWWDLWQEAYVDAQTKAWLDFLVDTEKHDILHNSVFATSVFDITSDQNYSVKAYTTGWFFIPEIGWLFSTKDTFPYIYDPTTGQWMQFLKMEGRYGFLHAQTMLLIDVNSSSISPISPFWDSDYYDSNLTLQNLNNAETNPLVAEIIGFSYSSFIGIEDGDFSPQSNLFEWVDIFSGKLPNLTQRINFNFVPSQPFVIEINSTYNTSYPPPSSDDEPNPSAEEDAPSEDELNESDSDRQASAKGVDDDDNGSEAVALEKAGLIDLDNPDQAGKVKTYVEVTKKGAEVFKQINDRDGDGIADDVDNFPNDPARRVGRRTLTDDERNNFVSSFAINDAFQNPDDYNWGSVFDISDDIETYILLIKDQILQAESDDYEASAYNGFTANLLNGIKVGHLKANLADDYYYRFIKELLVASGIPYPDDARLSLVTQNENNESRYEFYFHKDNLEVFKSLSDLTCDKPYTNGWYYTPKDGWLWTNNKVFPFIYKNESQAWLYFNSVSGAFYDYDLGIWYTE